MVESTDALKLTKADNVLHYYIPTVCHALYTPPEFLSKRYPM
jgi:hypothetical protein